VHIAAESEDIADQGWIFFDQYTTVALLNPRCDQRCSI
jgi:hypothetical protein